MVEARLGAPAPAAVRQACHEATGGNPLLIEALLAELGDGAAGRGGAPRSGSPRVGPRADRRRALIERAGRLDPTAPAVVRAVAGARRRRRPAALVARWPGSSANGRRRSSTASSRPRSSAPSGGRRFAHPLLRHRGLRGDPRGGPRRAARPRRRLLREQGAEPEAVAAHLLLCEPGGDADALAVARGRGRAGGRARRAGERRHLPAPRPARVPPRTARRGELLHRLGRAGVALRDPASIEHLQEAAQLTDDPGAGARHLRSSWPTCWRSPASGTPRWRRSRPRSSASATAAAGPARPRGDPRRRPRLRPGAGSPPTPPTCRACWRWSSGRTDEDVPAACAGCSPGSAPARTCRARRCCALIGPRPRALELRRRTAARARWSPRRRSALLMVDDLEAGEQIAAALRGRRPPARLAAGDARRGRVPRRRSTQRRGRLQSSEENLLVAIDLLQRNELSLMALTTFLHFCLDTIVERPRARARRRPGRGARGAAAVRPRPPAARCSSTCAARCGWPAATGPARVAGPARGRGDLLRPLRFGPRFSAWRSRLALALPEDERDEALELAEEELRLARAARLAAGAEAIAAAGARPAARRRGGHRAAAALGRATLGACASPLERARSLAELGAALRRGNQRREARESPARGRRPRPALRRRAARGADRGGDAGGRRASRAAAPSPAPTR